jgi:hypothetical protein
VLEEKSYSVFFQDWDFRRNFVEHIDEAERLIPVRVGALAEAHILDAMLYADMTSCW